MPNDGVDPNAGDGGVFGWVGAVVDWVRNVVRPGEYQLFQRGPDTSSTAVSDLASDIRLLAVIAVGVMMLSALALFLALFAILRHERNQPQWSSSHPGPWLHNGLQAYPSTGPVTQIGYAPGWHPDDQQLNPTHHQTTASDP